MPWMEYHPIRNTVWYCQYGDDRAKPTDIWTNNQGWIPRPICHNKRKDKECNIIHHCHHEAAPRGSKTGTQGKKGSYERNKIPYELCKEVLTANINIAKNRIEDTVVEKDLHKGDDNG